MLKIHLELLPWRKCLKVCPCIYIHALNMSPFGLVASTEVNLVK